MRVLPQLFHTKILDIIFRTACTFLTTNANETCPYEIGLTQNLSDLQRLRCGFVHRTTPTQYRRRRTEQFPTILGHQLRRGTIKPDAFGGTLLLDRVNDLVSVGKFHARVAENHDERRLGQGMLDQIQQDDGIFTAAERHMKTVEPLLHASPVIINAFDGLLPQIFHELKILLGHRLEIDRQERFTLR